ncbi:hypothetical protein M569_05872, partial [Genlisea aurea]
RIPVSPPSSQKQEFMKKWMAGLQTYSDLKSTMSIPQRKTAIKLAADVAIASTRPPATRWSRALIAAESAKNTGGPTRTILQNMSGPSEIAPSCRKIPPRRRRKNSAAGRGSVLRRRTCVLRRLVPGGKEIDDDVLLIEETLDYISSLRVQVDAMRSFAA